MGDVIERGAADPLIWIVVFKPTTESRVIRYCVPGRFKHVSALAYMEGLGAWLTFDVGTRFAKIMVLPDGPATNATISRWIDGCTLVRMEKNINGGRLPFHGWCVPAIRHLLGMRSGALRPDTLYRHCLRDGGKLLNEQCAAITGGTAAAAG